MPKDVTVEDELERCRPWIEAALEHSGGTHDFQDVVDELRSGSMQLWPAPKGCIVTQLVIYPKKKVIHVFLAGGNLEQILDMDEDVINWAKQQGCSAGTMSGRLGWKKPLTKLGWKPLHASYIKEFE